MSIPRPWRAAAFAKNSRTPALVIPAKAGIHTTGAAMTAAFNAMADAALDPRLRGDDGLVMFLLLEFGGTVRAFRRAGRLNRC